MFKILYLYLLKKYIKCNIWRVAVRPFYIWDARFLKVKQETQPFKDTAIPELGYTSYSVITVTAEVR